LFKMDRININNYEAFFLDYHEERLNSEEKQMVMAFLQEHPEFYDEFEDFENVVLPVPDIPYPDKSELFKTELSLPEDNDWEYKCIEFMEGDMADDELNDFEQERLSDPEKAKVLELYLATRSMPDESIVFEKKQELKKKVVLIPRWIYGAVSAAAVLILSWIIFTPSSGDAENPQMALDTVREKIYYDKIGHPGRYEKIASVDSHDKVLLESSLENTEDYNYTADRDSYIMASLAMM